MGRLPASTIKVNWWSLSITSGKSLFLFLFQFLVVFNFWWSSISHSFQLLLSGGGSFSLTTVFLCCTCPLWWSVVCWASSACTETQQLVCFGKPARKTNLMMTDDDVADDHLTNDSCYAANLAMATTTSLCVASRAVHPCSPFVSFPLSHLH